MHAQLQELYRKILRTGLKKYKTDVEFLSNWCKQINQYWDQKIELAGCSADNMYTYLTSFIDAVNSWFAEKGKNIDRFKSGKQASEFINSLEIKLPPMRLTEIVDRAIANLNQRICASLTVKDMSITAILEACKAYIRHSFTDYDVWVKRCIKHGYTHLKTKVHEAIKTTYPNLLKTVIKLKKAA